MTRKMRIILAAITIVLTAVIMGSIWSKPVTEAEKQKMYEVAKYVADSYNETRTIPEVASEYVLDTTYINQGKDSFFRLEYKKETIIVNKNNIEKARFADATIFYNLIMLIIIGAVIGFSNYGIYLVIMKMLNRNKSDNNFEIMEE